MKISRRNFLTHLGIQIPAAIALPSVSAAQLPFKSFQLVISGISDATPPDGFLTLLQPFVKAHIPISCIISCEADSGTLRPDSALAGYLRHLIDGYPAQIEVVLKTPTLGDRPYYFQSRLATQARRTLEDALLTTPSDTLLLRSVLTVANTGTSMNYELGGVRAAGFRTVLTLPPSGIEPVDSKWDKGVLHIFGGMHFELSDSYNVIEDALRSSLRDDPRSQLALSIEGLTPENVQPAVAQMTKIASLISGFTRAGQIVPTTPSDYHVRTRPNAETVIGLRLDVPSGPSDPMGASALELTQWLRAHDFPFTVAGHNASDWNDYSLDTCLIEEQSRVDTQGRCELRSNALMDHEVNPLLPPEVMMVASPEIDLIAGVDRHATLHPPRVAFVDTLNSFRRAGSESKMLEDTVLVLDPASFRTAAQRHKTTTTIMKLSQRAGFQITDVATFADKIQPRDSIRRVYHQTQDVMQREQSALAANGQFQHDLIRSDAALAWRYFKRFTDAETGLIPSTAFLGSGEDTFHNYATLWDIGSQLLGMIAAVELKLMTLVELNHWAALIIKGIPSVTVQGLQLPSAIIHVHGTVAPDPSFNTCDVGRLLNAFHRLRNFSPALTGLIERKVAGWSLQETILNGRMQNLARDQSTDRYLSHCTNYAARGFAAFNIAANSPYALLNGLEDADALIGLLLSASNIGNIGAEPLLLEGVELGFTPETQYLADVLFSAQLEDYRMTGTMRCVSEGPIDMSPWFTYSGFDMSNFDDPWTIQVTSDDKKFERPDFLRSIEMVSVKAAYLWAATHPHSYSHDLVAYVRSRARIADVGFSPGIYMATGRAMDGYSDLNTNAVILEACARILQ